jgi:hypothetical protein
MDKFQRNYELSVEGKDRNIYTFRYPTTLEFNVQSAALASANTGYFRIYNLAENVRRMIYKDIYDNVVGSFRSIRLLAGYGSDLFQVFNGNIKEAKSFREEGATNFITSIDGYDWSFVMVNTRSSWTLQPPVNKADVINRLVQDLAGTSTGSVALTKGFVSYFPGTYSSKFTAEGNTWDILREETNDHCFIDNGTIHCLLDEDTFEGDQRIIDASAGLLSTPKKSEYLLKLDVLFEPSIRLGQKIQLAGASETIYNGVYKVIGIQHTGIISGSVNGKCRTSLTLNAGEFALNVITGQFSRSAVAIA